jgi:hypothetical protein
MSASVAGCERGHSAPARRCTRGAPGQSGPPPPWLHPPFVRRTCTYVCRSLCLSVQLSFSLCVCRCEGRRRSTDLETLIWCCGLRWRRSSDTTCRSARCSPCTMRTRLWASTPGNMSGLRTTSSTSSLAAAGVKGTGVGVDGLVPTPAALPWLPLPRPPGRGVTVRSRPADSGAAAAAAGPSVTMSVSAWIHKTTPAPSPIAATSTLSAWRRRRWRGMRAGSRCTLYMLYIGIMHKGTCSSQAGDGHLHPGPSARPSISRRACCTMALSACGWWVTRDLGRLIGDAARRRDAHGTVASNPAISLSLVRPLCVAGVRVHRHRQRHRAVVPSYYGARAVLRHVGAPGRRSAVWPTAVPHIRRQRHHRARPHTQCHRWRRSPACPGGDAAATMVPRDVRRGRPRRWQRGRQRPQRRVRTHKQAAVALRLLRKTPSQRLASAPMLIDMHKHTHSPRPCRPARTTAIPWRAPSHACAHGPASPARQRLWVCLHAAASTP